MEEGGRVGSRVDTLLELLRKFIISVLFVLVSLISPSSLGLAIGFGSQTLVRDILTGVFF